MCRIVCGVIVVTFASAGVVWSSEKSDPRAIVDKAIMAMGGEAKLAKFNAFTFKEAGTYYGMGKGLPYTSTGASRYPDQFRMEIKGVFTMVLDKDKGWFMEGGVVKEMTKDEVAAKLIDTRAGAVQSLAPLKEKEFQLKNHGLNKDKTEVQVVVTRKDYPDVTLSFDIKTGLLTSSSYMSKAMDLGFKEVKMTTQISDYRDVEGAKMPHKMVTHRDGKLFIEAEMTELRPASSVTDKMFSRPGEK